MRLDFETGFFEMSELTWLSLGVLPPVTPVELRGDRS
jgi:hypothetical protein